MMLACKLWAATNCPERARSNRCTLGSILAIVGSKRCIFGTDQDEECTFSREVSALK